MLGRKRNTYSQRRGYLYLVACYGLIFHNRSYSNRQPGHHHHLYSHRDYFWLYKQWYRYRYGCPTHSWRLSEYEYLFGSFHNTHCHRSNKLYLEPGYRAFIYNRSFSYGKSDYNNYLYRYRDNRILFSYRKRNCNRDSCKRYSFSQYRYLYRSIRNINSQRRYELFLEPGYRIIRLNRCKRECKSGCDNYVYRNRNKRSLHFYG